MLCHDHQQVAGPDVTESRWCGAHLSCVDARDAVRCARARDGRRELAGTGAAVINVVYVDVLTMGEARAVAGDRLD